MLEAWPTAEPLFRQAMSGQNQSASGKALCFPKVYPQSGSSVEEGHRPVRGRGCCSASESHREHRMQTFRTPSEPPGIIHGEVQSWGPPRVLAFRNPANRDKPRFPLGLNNRGQCWQSGDLRLIGPLPLNRHKPRFSKRTPGKPRFWPMADPSTGDKPRFPIMASARPTSVQTLFCNRRPRKARFWPTSNPSTGIKLVFARTPRGMLVLNLVLTMSPAEIKLVFALENLAFSGINLALARKNEVYPHRSAGIPFKGSNQRNLQGRNEFHTKNRIHGSFII